MAESLAPLDVYLYGMTVLSTIHRLATALPPEDGYAEILETRVCPGGEAMNGAIVLSALGLRTAIGGPHWGSETHEVLARYAERHRIDATSVTTDLGYPGLRDVVLVAGARRTVLGWFARYFSETPSRWGAPDRAKLEAARIVAIDPFFGESSERAAQMATAAGKPFVTIDCAFDGALHAQAAATVVSSEFRKQHYSSLADDELLNRYTSANDGLTIFTAGNGPIRYARRAGPIASCQPPSATVVSTLGAGDTFRAGVVYGMLRGLSDSDCVRFAAGVAALICERFPIADCAPTLGEVETFLRSRSPLDPA